MATIPGQASADPPGNNGTVKVDDVVFDDHPNNEPHVGCVFQIDWYGFDKGDLFSSVTFEVHPPTGKPEVILTDKVFIGEDDNSGGGSKAGLDASKEYNLTDVLQGFPQHPQQGWHVKLTVNNDGSQGADVKHKVFWVSGCETPPTTSTSTTSTSTTSTTEAPTTSSTESTTTSSSTTSTTEAPTTSSTESTTTSTTTSSSTTSTTEAPTTSSTESTTTSTTEKPTTTSTTEEPTTSTTEAPTTSSTEAPTTSSTEATSTTAVAPSSTTTSLAVSPVGELPKTGGGSQTLLIAAGIILLLGGGALLGSTKLGQEGLA